MIVNVSGSAIEDYVKTAEIINELDKIPAIELNISCPNVKQGGMAFGVSAKGASEVVKAVRAAYKKTLIVKLSPNVTDITEIARAAEESGADSVSLINTLLGMAIDAERKRPILSTITGGMSGAAVKPIALRMSASLRLVLYFANAASYLLDCELFSSMIVQFWVIDMSFTISFRFLFQAFPEGFGDVYACLVGDTQEHP